MVEDIIQVQNILNNIVQNMESKEKEINEIKTEGIKNLEKSIKKIISYNTYEFGTGYGIGVMKDALKSLLVIVKDLNNRVCYLENKLAQSKEKR